MPEQAISAFDALPDASGAELLADRAGSTGKLTPEQLVTSRLASTTPAAVGTAAVGVGTTAARADHVHAHGDQAGGTLHADATTSVAGFMSASDKTKLDSVATGATATPLTAATPQAVGTAAVGVSTDAARADHVHAHGDQAGGTLHSTAVASGAAGFMSGSDKAKLDGIEALADVTDAANVNAAGAVMESDFSASHSLLLQQGGTGSPSLLTVAPSTLVGRAASGDINDLSVSDVKTLLAYTPSDIGAEPTLAYPATTAATSITLDASNDRTVIRTTAGTTVTVTVPSLAQGTAILIIQEGAGQVQLSASGVTLHHPATFLARAAEQYSEILLHWKTTTLVQVTGDLELAP